MPSGVVKFVSRSQGPDNNADSPNGKDLARRRAEAAGAKVQLKVSDLRAPGQSQAVYDRRTVAPAPTYVQPWIGHEQTGGDLFAGSVLSDSDDTTDMRGYQAMGYTQGRQDFGDRNGIEQDSEQGYKREYGQDEKHDKLDNADVSEIYPADGDGQSRTFHFQAGDAPMGNIMMDQVVRFRKSQNFADAEKAHNSKVSSSHIPLIHPGISGRFTAAKISAGEVRRRSIGLVSAAEVRHKSHPQLNDQAILDDLVSNDSDEHILQENLQQEEQSYDGQLESTTRTRVTTDFHSNAEQEAPDMFRASELGIEYSGGSSQQSPSQHTPRANGQSNKQTPTSSQAGKRKAELELDYDTHTLSTMKYSELKGQPFDSNPKAPPSVIPELLSGTEASLEDRLEHFRKSEPDDQISFFAQMPLDQWERSGDWFLGRFSDIMSKLKDARRAKRDVSKAFEKELATREEAVRGEAEGIQEVFRQMKAGGEGVLKGRVS